MAVKIRPFGGRSPRFGRRVFVASTAVLVGDVELADDVSIWYGAVLRGDLRGITIGARTNLQDNVVIHVDEPDYPTMVAEDVTVGHGAVLHGCRIGKNSLVGMNTVISDGAIIGESCIVAAVAFVKAGAVIPPRSLVLGVPAKVVRELTDAEIAWKSEATAVYQALAQRSLNSLKPAEALTAVEPNRARIPKLSIDPLYKSRQTPRQ